MLANGTASILLRVILRNPPLEAARIETWLHAKGTPASGRGVPSLLVLRGWLYRFGIYKA